MYLCVLYSHCQLLICKIIYRPLEKFRHSLDFATKTKLDLNCLAKSASNEHNNKNKKLQYKTAKTKAPTTATTTTNTAHSGWVIIIGLLTCRHEMTFYN